MELISFFTGKYGYMFSYLCTMITLVLTFFVSLRLFQSRRKKAYFSLAISITIIILQYLIMIIYVLSSAENVHINAYFIQLLHTFAFILINRGLYQLYNSSSTREFTFFVSFVLTGIILGAIRYYFVFNGANATWIQINNVGIEVYLLVLTVCAYIIVRPRIGQQKKYEIALIVYFLTQLSHILNQYVFKVKKSLLLIFENVAPVFFYMILFIIIFDRVVEILKAIYDFSIRDRLTGLYNRAYFFSQLAECIRKGEKAAVIFCDIDNFKHLNDTKGHQAGDIVLEQVASILKEESEAGGIAGRYGGEELVALITDPALDVKSVAERIRQRVEQETGVTISVGYNEYRGSISARELIEQADMAMYSSKKSGKNKVTAYEGGVT